MSLPNSDQLKFPCNCHIRVIAMEREGIQADLENVVNASNNNAVLKPGNTSKKGSYISFFVDIVFESLEQMNSLDKALRDVPGVRMVL